MLLASNNMATALLPPTLWLGATGLAIGLSFLLWTRWGRYHLFGKCVILSLIGHLLVGGYFATASVVMAVQQLEAESTPPVLEELAIAPENQPADESQLVEVVESEDAQLSRVGIGDRVTDSLELPNSRTSFDRTELPELQPEREPLPEMDPDVAELTPEAKPLEADLEPTPVEATPERELPRVVESQPASPAALANPEVTLTNPPSPEAKPRYPANTRVAIVPKHGTGRPVVQRQSGTSGLPEPTIDGNIPTPKPQSLPDKVTAVPEAIATTDDPAAADIILPAPLEQTVQPESVSQRRAVAVSPSGSVGPESATLRRRSQSAIAGVPRGSTMQRTPGPGRDNLPLPPAIPSRIRPSTSLPDRLVPAPTASPRLDPSVRNPGDVAATIVRKPELYKNRVNPNRGDMAIKRGASPESEKAVKLALTWLAAHQDRSGRWNADGFHLHCPGGDRCTGHGNQRLDDCATTGLVLLAFLGAGNTHQSGEHADVVARAISWLLSKQKSDGDLRGQGRMYSHGIATLALSEALGMTADGRLKGPVERAVSFIVKAQHPVSGGWRYQPGQYGDTSIFGWQLMAIKSAGLAGVAVPDSTWTKARRWLKLVAGGTAGGLASYLPEEEPTPAMTAEALVCRLFLGDDLDSPQVAEASQYLIRFLPRWSRRNLYYWYYGTVASYQVGGELWSKWNGMLRDQLVQQQVLQGHAAGSWDPTGDPWGAEGGRLYSTAMATLCLEIYYRYLPLQSLAGGQQPEKIRR